MNAETLLTKLARSEGYPTWLRLMEARMTDSLQPSICRHCGEPGGDFEPDAVDYPCDHCGENGVTALSEIAFEVLP